VLDRDVSSSNSCEFLDVANGRDGVAFTCDDQCRTRDVYQCIAEVCIANTIDDLRQVIEKARMEGRSIRVSGGGRNNSYSASFSGSPVVTNSEQIIVKTPYLNRIWAHNDGSNRVTAEGGATLKELDVVLHQNRLSILTSTAPNFISGDFEALTGLRLDDVHSDPRIWIERLHPDDREKVMRAVTASLRFRF